jgi:hypothetical protein
MARPIVLIATLEAESAYSLQKSLKGFCRGFGLKLEVGPEGTEAPIPIETYSGYDSSDSLFDMLEKRDPMELADTLLVLDLGPQVSDAFEPKAPMDRGWHATGTRPGVALELMLRFPQVFPVFLSSAVPVVSMSELCARPAADHSRKSEHDLTDSWDDLLKGLLVTHPESEDIDLVGPQKKLFDLKSDVPAFVWAQFDIAKSIHFVSSFEFNYPGLCAVLARFAHGMRCWFDPTGLRTLVRNRFLGALFGNKSDYRNSTKQRTVLLERFLKVCVAIDEERDFAALNAYCAYKFGRRAFMITTFEEFKEHDTWVPKLPSFDVVVLRDIDLRFPDLPDDALGTSQESTRVQLQSIHSQLWKPLTNKQNQNWRFRVVSTQNEILSTGNSAFGWLYESRRLGEDANHAGRKYLGVRKPIGSVYDLEHLLVDSEFRTNSVASRLSVPEDLRASSENGHGAPYLNLAMAEALLRQSCRCKEGALPSILGAFLAGEAYELLLCMSKTTALEALLLQQKQEVLAEVDFSGVAQAINIKRRRVDIDAILKNLDSKQQSASMENMFLSKYWSELRTVYKNGEQFEAAEQASSESLIHSVWLPVISNEGWLRKHLFSTIGVKRVLIRPAISFWGWLILAFGGSWVLTAGYIFAISDARNCGGYAATVSDNDWARRLQVWHQVVLSSLNSNPSKGVINFDDCFAGPALAAGKVPHPDFWLYSLTVIHFVFAFVMLGFLVAMIFRKITRA